jgi:Bax protein
MSSGIRALLLFIPMVVVGGFGTLHTPPPAGTGNGWAQDNDIRLASLPPLPDWSRDDLPDFTGYRDVTEKKAAFFSFLYPRIVLANSRILIERRYLEELASRDTLGNRERQWLDAQSERLRVEGETGSEQQFTGLRHKLDVIPPSLILAQAANESAWGTSRFATKGNNLFGQWCFSKGCGLVPLGRVEGATHEVAKFASPYRSVRSYIQNLNRHPTYSKLRKIRARSNAALPSGAELAAGLTGYSERGMDYVEEIRSMIRYNNLAWYDRQFAGTLDSADASALLSLASEQHEKALLPGSATDGEG